MKKLLISFAALALLAACSDDDDNNDVKEPEVLAKKITKIELTSTEEGVDPQKGTYTFEYNEEGKVKTIKEDDGDITTFTYDKDKVVVTIKEKGYPDETETYTLDNGRAKSYAWGDWNCTCEYNKDGYLSKILEKGKGEEEGTEGEMSFTYSKGNLDKIDWKQSGTEDDEPYNVSGSDEFTYGTQANNMNFDLFDFITEGEVIDSHVSFCGILGKRLAKLPETMTETDDDGIAISKFAYVTDKDGYITKITATYEDEDGVFGTTEYVITYEK